MSRFFNVLGHIGKGKYPYGDVVVVVTPTGSGPPPTTPPTTPTATPGLVAPLVVSSSQIDYIDRG